MTTLKENAANYEQAKTKNIADLEIVDVNALMEVRDSIDLEGKEYKYNVIVVDKEEYRVPDCVLRDLKFILTKKPTLKTFSVSKSGTGMGTRYQVLALD